MVAFQRSSLSTSICRLPAPSTVNSWPLPSTSHSFHASLTTHHRLNGVSAFDSALAQRWSMFSPLSSLESTPPRLHRPKPGAATPLDSALSSASHLKCPGINTYEKVGGVGVSGGWKLELSGRDAAELEFHGWGSEAGQESRIRGHDSRHSLLSRCGDADQGRRRLGRSS